MKRIFVSLAFTLTLGLATAFANDVAGVNNKVKESFEKEFSGAELIKWETVDDYQVATFGFHGHPVIAFYSQDGELLGSARDVMFDQLPMAIIKKLDRRFPGADFIEIHEINNLDGTCYWLTFETSNNSYHVKMNADGNILESARKK